MNTKRMLILLLFLACVGNVTAQTDWVPYEGNPVVPRPEADSWAGLLRWVEAVVVVDGTYHMFFTGTRTAFWADHSIGHATSPDGITWTMDPGNPVMMPVTEGDWDVTSFASLAVMYDGDEFRMWYTGVEGIGTRYLAAQIGYATSPDGINWTKSSVNPVDELGSWKAQPRVLLHPAKRECEMFYNGEFVGDFTVNRATSSCTMYSQWRRPTGRRTPQ